MKLAEIAESRGITLQQLAAFRLDWLEQSGEMIFPMGVSEVEWQIDQYNVANVKYQDQRLINQRGREYIRGHSTAAGSLELNEDQVDALLSILKGVE